MKTRHSSLSAVLRIIVILMIIFPITASPGTSVKAAAVVRYVDLDAVSGANNGTSWGDAFVHLQDALDWANSNSPVIVHLWVSEGVYYPDLGSTHTNDEPSESFTISHNNIRLFGGFSGVETSPDQADWINHPTILSGDIDGNDDNTDGNHIAEDWTDISGTNSINVLTITGIAYEPITADVIVNGFVITAGDGYGSAADGGGILCRGNAGSAACDPTFRNLKIQGNRAMVGGGVALYAGAGGQSNPTFTYVSFIGNWAAMGGGLNNYVSHDITSESSLRLTNCSFIDNVTTDSGAGLNTWINEGSSTMILSNVEFIKNETGYYGGAIYDYANSGAIVSFSLTNTSFSKNRADYGGGMYNASTGSTNNIAINNSILWGNCAVQAGNNIYNNSMVSSPVIQYSDIKGSGGSGSGWDTTIGVDGGNNIDADPIFTNALAGDLTIQPSGAAIDAGDQTLLDPDVMDLDEDLNIIEDIPYDLADNPRVENSNVDMGAYEHDPILTDIEMIGMFSPAQKSWYLKDANSDGWKNVTTVSFGSVDTSWKPVVGDWNGDGTDTIGLYSPPQKTWYLKDANNDGWGNVTTVRFGSTDTSWVPVVGDWNGNGTDTIGMYRPDQKTWYLKDANTDGWGNVTTVRFGSVDTSWVPVVGDWNGNGTDTIGMYSPPQKTWYLKIANNDGWGNVTTIRFGSTDTSWLPVHGDWDGNYSDTVAMYRPDQKTWYLKDANNDGWGDVKTIRFGSTDTSWIPVTGKW